MSESNCEKISLISLLSITCPSCKTSKGVAWHSTIETPSEIMDGCFRSHDIKPIFFAACEYCSGTIKVVNSDAIALMLTTFTNSIDESQVNTDKALALARKEQRHACADAVMNSNVRTSSDWKKEAHSACMNAYIN